MDPAFHGPDPTGDPLHMKIPSRGARRASLALLLGVTGAAALAPAASAATTVQFWNSPDGAMAYLSDNTPGGSTAQATVRRNGAVLATNDGVASAFGHFAMVQLPNNGTLNVGDE